MNYLEKLRYEKVPTLSDITPLDITTKLDLPTYGMLGFATLMITYF